MVYLSSVLFALVLGASAFFFARSIGRVRRNITLGRKVKLDTSLATMMRVALGQSKMVVRPVPAVLHLCVYLGFLVINIEVIEIVIDGLLGTHRVLSMLGGLYDVITAAAEVFFVLVMAATVTFLIRRNVIKVKRFQSREMSKWPRLDANIILWTEIVLITALVVMNAADQALQRMGHAHYPETGAFPITAHLVPLFMGMDAGTLVILERAAWWFHIVGILLFLNYIPYSKHFHIMMAFPNTYFTPKRAKGHFPVNERVKQEVTLMLDPSQPAPEDTGEPATFGVKDVFDLSRKSLMDAYTCTECGRCTSQCPANLTGKALSPRKVMMDTRDRMESVGRVKDANKGQWVDDGKTLHDLISREELWACTSCNACVEACPVNINPLDIILQMRQYLVMEQSQAPEALMVMFSNIENNGAPWPIPATDRFNWANAQ
ncbi:MAG: (Fe-S)-binding protein [Bacteroidetes bacterium]|nr:(Fe-S)-binding protein [Bacteroidota bacterium]